MVVLLLVVWVIGFWGKCFIIAYEVRGAGKVSDFESTYSWQDQTWPQKGHRPPKPGLVIYMRVDGSFAVWGPARNSYKEAPTLGVSSPDRPPAFFFDRESVWKGLGPIEKTVCEGLERDWITWQSQKDSAFDNLCMVLRRLSSESGEILSPGRPLRMRLEDRRDTPTLQLSYGLTPVPLASAGVKHAGARLPDGLDLARAPAGDGHHQAT